MAADRRMPGRLRRAWLGRAVLVRTMPALRWHRCSLVALFFPSHLERIGRVEATAAFTRGKHHAPFIYQVHQVGEGFAQRIEF